MDAKKVGEAIKTLRNRIGYTQHDLADYMGVTDKAVSKWERGISVPDIAIITHLSLILNCDVDNLLEGNIAFLEKSWQGLLILDENSDKIFAGTMIYCKPLVYFFISYFLLAGINSINIKCPKRDREFISGELGNGVELGIRLRFIDSINELKPMNTMVVYDNPFVYGPNLTKYFQRAMSKIDRISALTVYKGKGGGHYSVDFDNLRTLQLSDNGNCYCVPIIFLPEVCFNDLSNVFIIEKLISENKLYAEPMGNGMIEYSIKTQEEVFQSANFIRYLESTMGNKIYELKEIAEKRNLTKGSSDI